MRVRAWVCSTHLEQRRRPKQIERVFLRSIDEAECEEDEGG